MEYAQTYGKVNIEFAYNSRNSINRLTFLRLCVIIILDMRQRHICFFEILYANVYQSTKTLKYKERHGNSQ